ncbi:MAG: threonine--tRNA ligase [Candidatus Latescibacteria bacterium]|nr:threonine--tRNA ligase [Candidatus Latescibacterota bacterium]
MDSRSLLRFREDKFREGRFRGNDNSACEECVRVSTVRVTLPDGKHLDVPSGSTVADVARQIGPRLAREALAARVDGQAVDLSHRLDQDAALAILTFDDPAGRDVYWHSSTHLMAQAVKELFPETQLTIGPPIADGFYYDFDKPEPFSLEDLERIEGRMAELAAADLPIVRRTVSREDARALFSQRGEHYKVEMLDEFDPSEVISTYEQGEFIDLCRGPHVPSTGRIKAFKLLSVAGAYWRGDEHNKMLQRIYGVSYPDRAQLDEHLQRLEEAQRRDHRKLGRELGLFMFHPFAPASPFFFPKGARVYNTLVDYVRGLYQRYGYEEVITPLIYEAGLWKISGHYEHFWEEMFTIHADEREYAAKAMNCPSHCLMYAANHHSYRELPIRYADFARLHRYERSGVTAGLMRVRSFSQDDAHIFCRLDQIQTEIQSFMEMLNNTYTMLGFEDVQVYLSTRPPKRAGTDDVWDRAESTLANVLHALNIAYEVKPGEGAFYGPKVDIDVNDALKRPWQLGTVQLDFNMPEQFQLEYVTETGAPARPAMIHRAMLGSLERFLGVYIEHCAGAFPTWLAPVQVVIMSISARQADYTTRVACRLDGAGLRVETDLRNEKVGFKVRDAETQKVPYMLIAGDREVASETVSVRKHGQGDLGSMRVDEFLSHIQTELAPLTAAGRRA